MGSNALNVYASKLLKLQRKDLARRLFEEMDGMNVPLTIFSATLRLLFIIIIIIIIVCSSRRCRVMAAKDYEDVKEIDATVCYV